MRSVYALDLGVWTAFTAPVRILELSRLAELGVVGIKPAAAAAVVAVIAWTVWRARHETRLAGWAFVCGSCVFTYFMWNTQVHENHLYLAVLMFGLAGAVEPRWRTVFWAVSALTAFNMYIFYGVGSGQLPLLGRRWSVIDLTVLVSVVNLWLWGRTCFPQNSANG